MQKTFEISDEERRKHLAQLKEQTTMLRQKLAEIAGKNNIKCRKY
jgi:hypothetical protein